MVKKKIKKQPKLKKEKNTSEKTKTKKSKTKQKKNKEKEISDSEIGIVVIDEELVIDKNAELEEKKLYLEEAKSQEASD